MTHQFFMAGAAAALTLFTTFAVCSSDAQASHDQAADHGGQAAVTHPAHAGDASANVVPAALRPMAADDDVPAPQTKSPVPSSITSANYIAVGTGVYNALQSVNSYSGLPVPVAGEASDDAPAPNLTRQAIDLLMFAIAGEAPGAGVRKSACHSGGTADTVASLQQAARFSPGDRISLALSDCRLNADTPPVSGKVVFTITEIDGAASARQPWHAAVDVQLHELTAAYSGNAIVGNGDMSVDIRQGGLDDRIVSVHSARLSEEVRSGLVAGIQFAPAAHTYSNYKAVETQEGSSSAWEFSYGLTSRNGYFYTSEFVVNTLQPMVFDGGRLPVSGEVKVTGKNSAVTMTVLEGEMARLDLSENDDGLINQTTFLPLTKLLAE